MPFVNRDYPGQIFDSFEEFEEARHKRKEIENSLAERAGEIINVTATVLPASKKLLEQKIVDLERKMDKILKFVERKPTENKEGLRIGLVLRGESRGREYTLEVIDEGYLCSNGVIYQSLSGAAEGVSENRRSGWKFWKDVEGTPIGNVSGRFKINAANSPFNTQ